MRRSRVRTRLEGILTEGLLTMLHTLQLQVLRDMALPTVKTSPARPTFKSDLSEGVPSDVY